MVAIFQKEWWKELDLNYAGENNYSSFFSSDGNIHTYPAKAVPQMVNSLLKKLIEEYSITTVLDPFVGSGTVALESKYLGLDFYGSDLNPLSILLARTKTLTVNNTVSVEEKLSVFVDSLIEKFSPLCLVTLVHFDNIEYWFKPRNIKELSFLKENIEYFLMENSKENRETFALILLTAFSSTIRACSLTRNNEFKLYKKAPNEIIKFDVDSLVIFKEKILSLLSMLVETNKISHNETITNINLMNAKDLTCFNEKKVDLILTSPPYGDSQSTVAYGQFSRQSLQWSKDLLDKHLLIKTSHENVDDHLLGGKKSTNHVSIRKILRRSPTFRKLFIDMRGICREEILEFNRLKFTLNILQESISSERFTYLTLTRNEELFELIRERIRLDNFRNLNKSTEMATKDIKEEAKKLTELFLEGLKLNPQDKGKIDCLASKLPFVYKTINRKIKALPRRVRLILHFFVELYLVIKQTDKVLTNKGVQAWIVGHRTVLGTLTVDMATILNEWFESLGYIKITTLRRQYSFKRLPHHINSTATRKNEIKTMMEEHIVVVRKDK